MLDVKKANNVAKHVNHFVPGFFEENCGIFQGKNGSAFIKTTRKVRPGEEFFCDYGDDYWKGESPLTKKDLLAANKEGKVLWRECDDKNYEDSDSNEDDDDDEEYIPI